MAENLAREIAVVQPNSPLVDRIINERTAGFRDGVPLTSAQYFQSNRALVAEVLNQCFWASLAHEEGRPVASGVTFVGPDEMGLSEPLSLERPELLTQKNLVHLATVAGTTHRLAVHQLDGKAYIWGLLRGEGPPYWLTIWFDRPARLRVMVEGGFILGVLDRGKILTPHGNAMANRWNVRTQLQNLLGTLRPDLIEALMYVANEMSRHGHGGALLVVSGDLLWKEQLRFTYSLDERSRTLLRRLRQRPQPISNPGSAATHEELDARAELARAAEQVASLTKIDGAAVVGIDLEVFGFGARITSDDLAATKPILRRRTIYEQDFAEVPWTDLGGTRHQSAARFVAATKTSAAFVASHDGGLSTLAWKAEPPPGHLEWLCGLEDLVAPR